MGSAHLLELSHQVINQEQGRRMAVFGSGIHLRASHLCLGDLGLGLGDRGIWPMGSPLPETVSSVGNYGVRLVLTSDGILTLSGVLQIQ